VCSGLPARRSARLTEEQGDEAAAVLSALEMAQEAPAALPA
jgi:hypothetical protein